MADIKKLRTEKGMTQMEVAKACGVSLVTFQLWEREISTPNQENMEKLKKVLGC
jgi:transcriptional regulator with XRE-family HTH domain